MLSPQLNPAAPHQHSGEHKIPLQWVEIVQLAPQPIHLSPALGILSGGLLPRLPWTMEGAGIGQLVEPGAQALGFAVAGVQGIEAEGVGDLPEDFSFIQLAQGAAQNGC
jgi:hypothetical protein